MAQNDNGNSVLWFLAGAATGAAVALLYAPKSGKDTRRYLQKQTRNSREAIESGASDLMDRGKDLYERGRRIADDAADLFERGRKLVRH